MTAIDPVCGMKVETDGAQFSAERESTTYYFCSTDCQEEFESDPESYV
ncbi:MAG: YHS domain-containing protein [Acidimicrobiales bacterium]